MSRGKYILSLSIIMFICMLLVSGGTYAFLTYGTDVNGEMALDTTCFIMDYDYMNDDGTVELSGTLFQTSVPKSGLSGKVSFGINSGCSVCATGSIYLNVGTSTSSVLTSKVNKAHCEDPSTLKTMTDYTSSSSCTSAGYNWVNNVSALKYAVYENVNSLPVSVGYIDKTGDITIYEEFELEKTLTPYYVYIWLDGELADNSYLNVSFDGHIHLGATQTECPKGEAYAIYSEDDNSLRFYRSETPVEEGSTYNGLTATAVYTGFENTLYSGVADVPWVASKASKITNVIFEDEISPISTAYWFGLLLNCASLDVAKLDTSKVMRMTSMFAYMGATASNFTIIGLENWDTSNVTDMNGMFYFAGRDATTWNIGDLSGWDTSQVTDMSSMFYGAGSSATNNWALNLSGWNVNKVIYWYEFNTNADDTINNKITPPIWEYGDVYYAVYSADDNSLRFYKNNDTITVGNVYNNLTVTDKYTMYENQGFSSREQVPWEDYKSTILTVAVENYIYPSSVLNLFSELTYCTSIDIIKLDISKITDFYHMFYNLGRDASSFTITGLEQLDVSEVTNMNGMFYGAGSSATTWSIGNLSNWDVSNVTDMSNMFYSAGQSATTWSIGNIGDWDTSKVTDMGSMFRNAGKSATTWSIDLSNWDTSKVTDMSSMFYYTGYNATVWSVAGLNNWDTSNVTDMYGMFADAGHNVTTWSIDLSNWDTSNVTSIGNMFSYTGYNASTFIITGLENWNVSNLRSLRTTFNGAGYSATTWSIGDLSNWNVSNVTDMYGVFSNAGYSATTWSIDLSNWDVSNVTNMSNMFNDAGRDATTWSIGDLSDWDVSNVTDMTSMFHFAGYSTTTWSIGDLSDWDVSNVTDMLYLFAAAGYSATTFSLGNLSNWDTSQVTDMRHMFSSVGRSATTWSIGDLSSWDTSKVTGMNNMFSYAGYSATKWSIGNISDWDVSNVTDMAAMFQSAGKSATNWSLDLSSWNVCNVTSYNYFASDVASKITEPSWGMACPTT